MEVTRIIKMIIMVMITITIVIIPSNFLIVRLIMFVMTVIVAIIRLP